MTESQDGNDDDISVSSTVASPQVSEYEVEAILAEWRFPDMTRYLVKWANYPEWRNSWEPADAFSTDETLADWEQRKREIAEGKREEYDVAKWELMMVKIDEEKQQRRRRRQAKRRRLGLLADDTTSQTLSDGSKIQTSRDSSRVSASKGTAQTTPSDPTPSSRPPPLEKPILTANRVVSKPPLVLFGSCQKSTPAVPRATKTAHDTDNKWFSHLSTRRKHEKAKFREPPPDISQLQLVRPSEWPSRTPLPPIRPGPRHVSPSPDRESNQTGTDQSASHTEAETSNETARLPANDGPSPSMIPVSPRKDRSQPSRLNESSGDLIPNLPRREPGPQAKFVAGRFCNPHEVLVDMYYGPDKKRIGLSRLCGLNVLSAKNLIYAKDGSYIEVWFQHLCTMEDYRVLCHNATRNRTFCTGWIEGYDDTEANVYRMAQELERGNFMAVFPGQKTRNVLIAFPSNSPTFAPLNYIPRARPDTFLKVIARSPLESLNSIERLHSRLGVDDWKPDSRGPDTPVRDSPRCKDFEDEPDAIEDKASSSSMSISPVRQGPESKEDPSVEIADSAKRESSQKPLDLDPTEAKDSPDDHQAPVDPMEIDQQHSSASAIGDQQLISALATADLKTLFKDTFGVSYEELVKVNAAEKVQMAEAFYLMFDFETHHQEFLTLQAFLNERNPVIYSSHQEGDWEKFARTVSVGVVLFHESFVAFHTLPFFKNLICKPFNFWSVSLNKPLEYAERPSHFQRIFPHGGVILITEDFMLGEPDGTIIILAWFNDWIKKKFPGNWKIMFRPAVMDWLLKQPEPADESKHGIWLTMYRLILQSCSPSAYDTPSGDILTGATDEYFESNAISPPNLPNYGSRTEEDNPDIPKGLTQDHRNTDHLVEFFAGWGLVHRHRYRRFVVLTRLKPLPRWEAWQHIEIKWGAKDFMKTFRVDYRQYWAKLNSSSSTRPSTAGEPKAQPQPFTPHTPRVPAPAPAPAPGLSNEMDGSRYGRLPASGRPSYPEPYH
ncbi:chromo domain protein [Aspergillus sclerotiicarbonarius CBS 121057]|uniref:Chromo domain protein n=1 Tax=Aspergillus sclerotiicarbonarius (strain CBS 121057 / IBT 28362) TaxID=1448318 RepID=A0A319E1B1_ASPSB|nr:chromo domain protein [Aspergillus sclerotiicarbonarius CBS 121057]